MEKNPAEKLGSLPSFMGPPRAPHHQRSNALKEYQFGYPAAGGEGLSPLLTSENEWGG